MGLMKLTQNNYDHDKQIGYPFEQEFKGKKIKLAYGESMVMDESEAEEFLGTMNAVIRDADGQFDPRSFKKFKKEKVETKQAEAPKAGEHICQACAYEGTSSKDIEEHIKLNHLDQIEDPEVAEALRNKKAKLK